MDGPSRPRPTEIRCDSAPVQRCGDVCFTLPLVDEPIIDFADNLSFFRRTGHKDDTIGCDAFVLAMTKLGFRRPMLVDE
jgi:hypothetical protein